MIRYKKVITAAVVVLAFAAFATNIIYTYHLILTSPTEPNSVTGQVVVITNHSSYLYVTPSRRS